LKNYIINFSCRLRTTHCQLIEERSYISINRMLFLLSNLTNIFVHMGLYCAVGEILVSQVSCVFCLYILHFIFIKYKERILYFFVWILHVYFTHLKCDRVYYAICDQEWYFLDSRNAKDLIFLMIRARILPYITAGKIFPLTIATFCNVRYHLWILHNTTGIIFAIIVNIYAAFLDYICM